MTEHETRKGKGLMNERWSPEDAHKRTCMHEAGHAVIGKLLGATIGAITTVPGSLAAGVTQLRHAPVPTSDLEDVPVDLPIVMWPLSVRHRFECEAIELMAGVTAEISLAWPKVGRQPKTIVERVRELPRITQDEAKEIAASSSDETNSSDESKIIAIAELLHGNDSPSRNVWLLLMQAQTDTLVSLHRREIERLAGILSAEHTIGSAAARQILEGE